MKHNIHFCGSHRINADPKFVFSEEFNPSCVVLIALLSLAQTDKK